MEARPVAFHEQEIPKLYKGIARQHFHLKSRLLDFSSDDWSVGCQMLTQPTQRVARGLESIEPVLKMLTRYFVISVHSQVMT